MEKFKVGDIVRAKKTPNGREYYGITTSCVRCKVVGINTGITGDEIRVVLVDTLSPGAKYNVNPEHFRHEYNRSE